jgi:hypothetical protein
LISDFGPDTKLEFRIESEIYSAAVSVPTVPAYPAWLAARRPNPFVEALGAAAAGPVCLAKPAVDYGSFDGLEPVHFALYLTPRGLWSRAIADSLRVDEGSALELMNDYPDYTDGAYIVYETR